MLARRVTAGANTANSAPANDDDWASLTSHIYVPAEAPSDSDSGEFTGHIYVPAEAPSDMDGSELTTNILSFGPLSIDWFSAWWGNDPNWTNPGDGNNLSGADAWDDATGNGHHLSVTSGSPVFRESDANFGNRSVVDFDGADMATATFTDQGAQVEYFVVAKSDESGTVPDGGFLHGTTGHRVGFGYSGGAWRIFQGSIVDGGTVDQNVHTFNARFAATDELFVDGSSVASGNAGTETLERIRMATFTAGGGSNLLDGKIAFAAVKIGALTAQERSNLEVWAADYYGI